MKFDLANWKKIKTGPKTTTMQHPDGHQITIAHEKISPKMRASLAALPVHKEEGGKVEDVSKLKQLAPLAIMALNDGGQVNKQMSDEEAEKKGYQVMASKGGKVEGEGSEAGPHTAVENQRRRLETDRYPQLNTPAGKLDDAARARQIQQGNRDPDSGHGFFKTSEAYNARHGKQKIEGGFAHGGEVDDDKKEPKPTKTPEYGTPDIDVDKARQVMKGFKSFGMADGGEAPKEPTPMPQRGTEESMVPPPAATGNAPVVVNVQAPAPQAPAAIPQAAQAPAQPGAVQPALNDPYGTETYYRGMEQGIREQKAGLQQQAAAESQLGQAQAAQMDAAVRQQQDAHNAYNSNFNALTAERQAFMQDYQNQHIDPQRYLKSMSTLQRVGTAIGLILGGANAQQFLQHQIDNDINAQKAELGKSENLLSANIRQYGNIRDAMDMTRLMQTDIIKNQMAAEAARTADPMAKARLLQAIGQLDQQSAPILSQIAMRRTLLQGAQQGKIPPEHVIRAVVPKEEQANAYKELGEAQHMNKVRDNLLSTFDQLDKIDTLAQRYGWSPIQTRKQVSALRDPLVAALSKETAGRFTEADSKMVSGLFPAAGDSPETVAKKRAAIIKIVNEKMNFPLLKAWGIQTGAGSRYAPTGEQRFQESAPVVPQPQPNR